VKQILDIRRDERPQALLISSYFFLVITAFWTFKMLKNTLLLQFYDQSGLDLMGWQLDAALAENPQVHE